MVQKYEMGRQYELRMMMTNKYYKESYFEKFNKDSNMISRVSFKELVYNEDMVILLHQLSLHHLQLIQKQCIFDQVKRFFS
jgi:hypothetical protein